MIINGVPTVHKLTMRREPRNVKRKRDIRVRCGAGLSNRWTKIRVNRIHDMTRREAQDSCATQYCTVLRGAGTIP